MASSCSSLSSSSSSSSSSSYGRLLSSAASLRRSNPRSLHREASARMSCRDLPKVRLATGLGVGSGVGFLASGLGFGSGLGLSSRAWKEPQKKPLRRRGVPRAEAGSIDASSSSSSSSSADTNLSPPSPTKFFGHHAEEGNPSWAHVFLHIVQLHHPEGHQGRACRDREREQCRDHPFPEDMGELTHGHRIHACLHQIG